MSEVSDSSNTSSAPETSAMGAPLAPAAPSLRPSEQDAASGRDLFDDRILTVSSADAARVSPIKGNGGDSTMALGAGTPGTTALNMADDGMSSLGTDRDLTMTDSSASHLGDMIQSDPVAAPNSGDSRASQPVSIRTSLADHAAAANDILAPGSWHDAGSSAHRNSASSRGTDLNDDAGSADASDPSRHPDHRTSSTLDVLPLDNVVDFPQHHNAPADDDAHGSGHPSGPILNSTAADDAGHVSANHGDSASHNGAASSGSSLLASDDAETHQVQAAAPSTGALVEAGAKAILLATDESPSRIGHASAADFAPGAAPSHSHTTEAFSPTVLGARDQLASAIATATPEAAAITTLPPPQAASAAIPTLGSDMHALQKHAA